MLGSLAIGVVCLVAASLTGISDNLPGIVLMLVGACAILYAFLHRLGEWRGLGAAKQLIYWAPRTLSIVFALFLILFAFDVFEENAGFWKTLLAFLMHIIPTFVVLGVLVVSWRREWIGGIAYIALAICYIIMQWGRFPLMTYLAISGPLVMTGLLFLLNWYHRIILRRTVQP